ncbi:MAG: protein kinase [Methylococcales bacterium]
MSDIHKQILPVGTRLGVYEIKEAFKIDAFNITYRAWNHHLKERVEIQEYFPFDLAMRGNDGIGVECKSPSTKENFAHGLKAFLDQAEILTQIEHTNIVSAENVLQFNGTAYLILASQKGVALSKLVQSAASFAETELKFILVSMLNALQKVHEYKIVHGGIQPTTIMLDKSGEPLLTDFAAARLAIAARTTKIADILSAGYAAPELYEQAHKPQPADDFYALAATIYYCVTHNQPIAAQSRIMALHKGEPDPLAPLSGSSDSPYSTELLQAIDWMLQPEANKRPQAATEVLTLLKSEPIDTQTGPITATQNSTASTNSNQAANTPLWIGALLGIVALVAVSLWFGKKPSETADKASAGPDQSLVQGKPITPETQVDQAVAPASAQSTQAAEPDKISEHTKKDLIQSEKQVDQEIIPNTSAAENQALSASKSVSKPGFKDKAGTEHASDQKQHLAALDKTKHQAKKQQPPKKPSVDGSVKSYLAAARSAMKALRLTTPIRDNASKYYQMVLAIEPDNAEALAGRQKIVNRYVWFIRKSKAEGNMNSAMRALQKAESVLPNDPQLHEIREKFFNKD